MAKVKNKEAARAIKFALFSASAGIIEFVSIALLDAVTPWRHFYCYLVGLVLSVLWNFTLNRRYTFKSANNVPIAMLKVACFYAVFTPLSTWLDKVLTENYLWPGMLSTVLIMSTNFVTENRWIPMIWQRENRRGKLQPSNTEPPVSVGTGGFSTGGAHERTN